MGDDTELEDWSDLTIVDKAVTKVRASYAATQFTLSAKPPKAWVTTFREKCEADPAYAGLTRTPGPSVDGETIEWEIHEDEIETGWKILKPAVSAANEAYGKIYEARIKHDKQLQDRLDARDKKRDDLNKKMKSFK
jgi:hypothetical protein